MLSGLKDSINIYIIVIFIILCANKFNGFVYNIQSHRIACLRFTAVKAKITLFCIHGKDFIGNPLTRMIPHRKIKTLYMSNGGTILPAFTVEKEKDLDFLLESFELLQRKAQKVLLRELLKDWWEKFPLQFSEQKEEVTVIIQSMYGSVVDEETLIDHEQLLELVSALKAVSAAKHQRAIEEDESKSSYEHEIDESSLKDVFVQLSGGGEKITVEAFKTWEVLTQFIASGYVTDHQIDSIISDIPANDTEQGLDYDSFISLVHHIDAVVSVAMHPDESRNNEIVGEIKESMLKDVFDQLRGDCSRISGDKIQEWDVIRNLISTSEIITAAYVDSLLEVVVSGGTATAEESPSLDFAQFVELAHRLDAAMRHHASDVDVVDEEASRVEDSLLKPVFDQLSNGGNTLPVKDIKGWDVIGQLIQSEMIAMETIDTFIRDLLVGYDQAPQSIDDVEFNYGQFVELAHMIDGATLHISGHGNTDEDDTMSNDEMEGGVEEVLLRKAFTHLCGDGQTTVSVDSIKEWDVISHLIFSGALTAREVDAFIEELHGVESKDGLSYTQFFWLAHRIDEATHSVDKDVGNSDTIEVRNGEDSESESARGTAVDDQVLLEDLFSQLSVDNQSVSIESLLSWSVIQRVVESRLLSRDAIETLIRDVLGDRVVAFDFQLFVELMHRIDQATTESYGNAFYSPAEEENSSDCGVIEPELEENLRSAFDQLRSVSTTPKSTTIPLKVLREWDLINHLVAIGSLQSDDLERIMSDLFCGEGEEKPHDGNEVDFCQFVEFAHRINNATASAAI